MVMNALSADAIGETDVRNATQALSEHALHAGAIVFQGDQKLAVETLELVKPEADDLVVEIHWSGISTGTERLLWSGEMPPFPGLSYPLVPGYESVGRVIFSQNHTDLIGRTVFVPGAHSFKNVAGLFGATADTVVVPADRCLVLKQKPQKSDILLALAATAYHAVKVAEAPDLIIGHGVLGRLIARISIALGNPAPTVWETNPARRGSTDYEVTSSEDDAHRAYKSVCDASGNVPVLDTAISRMARGGVLTLAGFYSDRPSFNFPPAFMRELTIRIAAEWARADLEATQALRDQNLLSFEGLITHQQTPDHAYQAYKTAFSDMVCLKMVLDWRAVHDHAS